MLKQDPDCYSFFVYNGQEALKKIDDWRKTLSWITPFYAIKSNPISPLLNDLISRNTGFDCASKGVRYFKINMNRK
jgi:diaminopimelate decarboxylase